ncbi:transposase [Actinomadura sp. ATCC 31491]|uniref:Transposase n=1 Tax=Actinomadura luzonensis TaxID=2805427 RepID=A0ABT0FQY8_9ACTN|nr:transposase [Actinomadura luzonensis]
MRPLKARTWSRRGCTPIVTVSGKGSGRVNLAGLICCKPGQRTRLIYRMMIYRRRKYERKGFNETDYARLLGAAHQQLGGPIVLIWDNVNIHVDALMRSLIDTRAWLTVVHLPAYAPELNPMEMVWSHLKGGLGNLAPCTLDDLAAIIRSRLKQLQYRPGLLNAFLAHTGLIMNPRST